MRKRAIRGTSQRQGPTETRVAAGRECRARVPCPAPLFAKWPSRWEACCASLTPENRCSAVKMRTLQRVPPLSIPLSHPTSPPRPPCMLCLRMSFPSRSQAEPLRLLHAESQTSSREPFNIWRSGCCAISLDRRDDVPISHRECWDIFFSPSLCPSIHDIGISPVVSQCRHRH